MTDQLSIAFGPPPLEVAFVCSIPMLAGMALLASADSTTSAVIGWLVAAIGFVLLFISHSLQSLLGVLEEVVCLTLRIRRPHEQVREEDRF